MKNIKVPIYDFLLFLAIGDEFNKIINHITRVAKRNNTNITDLEIAVIKETLNPDKTLGFTLPLEMNGSGILWLNPKLDPKKSEDFITLSHEVNHICIDVFTYVKMGVNKETEEAFCYLHDYLLKVCLEELEKKKKDGNNNTVQDTVGPK